MKRARGLKDLVIDAVEHGSRAVEKVQIETAKVPFDLLEKITPLKVPVAGVRLVYNTSISNVHGMIRLITKVTGDTVDAVLEGIRPAGAEGAAVATTGEKAAAPAEKAAGPETRASAKPA